MIRPFGPLAAIAVLAAAPALGAEGGRILSGEHGDFSRLVLRIDPETQWSLETESGRAILRIPGKALEFGTRGIFDLIPRNRIADVTTHVDDTGTTIELALACDCRVSTVFVDGRYLAVDVGERTGPDPAPAATESQETAETPSERDARESKAVASAEAILLQQIERAADQGIVDFSDTTAGAVAAGPAPDAAAAMGEPESEDAPPAAPAPAEATAAATAATTPPEVASDAPAEPAPAPIPSPPLPTVADAPPPARPARTSPVALAGDQLQPDGPEAEARLSEALAALIDGDQIRATTVYDRDRAAAKAHAKPPAPPPECLPAATFDMTGWSDRRPFRTQAADYSRRVLGEFDAPDPVILSRWVQLDIRTGLGREAEMLLDAFPGVAPEEALYRDLARTVEGRPLVAGGPLSRPTACPGAHGLWQALGGAVPAYRGPEHFAGVQEALGNLPPDMRLLLGPTLIVRLLDADEESAARLVYDTIARVPGGRSPDLILAEARLVAAEGNPVPALQALTGLVESDAPNGAEALAALAAIAGGASIALPDRLVTDLEAAALQARGTPLEPQFRALTIAAKATRGDTAGALDALRDAAHTFPGDRRFPTLAARVMSAAEPTAEGGAAYARLLLDNLDLLPADADADTARETVARHLLDLGLAPAARTTIAPALARGRPAARMLEGEALIRGGDATQALAAISGLDTPEAVSLRAEAQAQEGAFSDAVKTLAENGRETDAAAYAWPSGDWPRVQADDNAGDRKGMAAFMEGQTPGTPAPAPAPDPASLDGAAAFAEPLPALKDPSLEAARRLLTTGSKVESFVQGLLEPTAGDKPTSGAVSP